VIPRGGVESAGRLALLYTVSDGRPVWGVASLDDELFVVREQSTDIEVYCYTTLCRRLDVPGLATARDLAACPRHACLYITDVGNNGSSDDDTQPSCRYAIHRFHYIHL